MKFQNIGIVKKTLHSGNYGYLNLAVNHPEILKEINLIRKLVKSFNKGRAKIWKYRDLIFTYHKSKPDFINLKHEASNESSNSNDTAIRLAEKCSPYDKEEFKVISIRAFISTHMRELFTNWEEDPSTPIVLTEATNEVIDNLKFEYSKLQKWDNLKIINRISDN